MSDSASVGVEQVNESQIQEVREKHGERETWLISGEIIV